MARTVLVTGGAGYVGSHACKALALAGCHPVVFDDLSNGHEWAVQWGPLEQGNILDRDRLDQVMSVYQPSAVMHFAAFAYVGESVEKPADYYRNNLVGSLCLLDAARDAGIDRIVFSSSCATYGLPDKDVITEEDDQRPINPYGASKLMIERCMSDYGVAYGLKSISLRYFNAAGADPGGEIGEYHKPETHLLPLAINAALNQKGELTIYGDDYDTPDGTCIRDFVHVGDLAIAHVLALNALENGVETEAINLGSGTGYSVKEVIDVVERITGNQVTCRKGERRPGDPDRLVAATDKARRILGWQPEQSDLETIVRTAFEWHQGRS